MALTAEELKELIKITLIKNDFNTPDSEWVKIKEDSLQINNSPNYFSVLKTTVNKELIPFKEDIRKLREKCFLGGYLHSY